MADQDKPAGSPRPVASIVLAWDPEKGELNIKTQDLSNMEALGVLFSAGLEVYMATKKRPADSLIVPGRPLTPHLRGK